ncbi:MAG TPA: hypothetical protein VFF86_10435 [Candidatus Methylomirabilis sp.]|nr:hypothetical protein [Candidatus Methylomirabilis sp.]
MRTTRVLLALVILGLGGTISGMAMAVEVDRGGYGDAILIPYFDVNNVDTLISIESNILEFQVARVRFRSANTGAEALAFTLCLAPGGSWTAGMSFNGATAHVISSSPMLADGAPGLNRVLAGNTTRGYIEVIGLREGGATQAVCSDPSQGEDTSNFSLLARTYYVAAATTPILAFGTNAIALRDFSTVKLLESATMFGVAGVAEALILNSNFSGTAFASRFFIAPNLQAETNIVLTFPVGAGGCSSCTIPGEVLITPFADGGTQLPSLTRPAGQVVSVITLTGADITAAEGSFVLEATTSDTLPAVALIIQTTSSSAAIFFNVLFQGQLF